MNNIKPSDHKLHVRVDILLNLFANKLIHQTSKLGYTHVTNTENYTNFYVYVDKSVDRESAQKELEAIFTNAGYILK